MNCDDIYNAILTPDGGDGYSLFDLAQCFINGYEPARLRAMLASTDDGIVSDGLFVLGEIGSLAKNYAAEIATLTRSADAEVQRKAKELASIYVGSNP